MAAKNMSDLHRELLGLGLQRTFQQARGTPKPLRLESIPVPSGELAEKATKFAFDKTDETIFNHSLRSFFWGAIIGGDQFPDWHWDRETFYLASVLHDVGLAVESIDNTVLSFEFDGALQAHNFLISNGAEKHKADIVFEAIARHTDLVETGKRPEGTLLSIGALMDIGGMYAPLLHPESITDVVVKYPALDMLTVGSERLQYEVDKKNGQCHAKYLLDLGMGDAVGHNPLWAHQGHSH